MKNNGILWDWRRISWELFWELFWGCKVRVLIAICALLAATDLAWPADSAPAPASAASPVAPAPTVLPYSWAGFYIRGSGDLAGALEQTPAKALDGGPTATDTGPSVSNGIASGEIGSNWQTGNTVVGWQGDMQWSDQWATPLTACGLGCSLNDRVRVPWMATLRARAGKTFDRLFIYGTGGFAKLGTSDNLNPAGTNAMPNFVDLSPGNVDWTVGGGMEFALDQNMSAKIEYLYMPSVVPSGALNSLSESNGNDAARNNIVRGGIDYRLPIGTW